MTKEKKPRKKTEKQLLIEALIGENRFKCNWALEMKILGHLLAKINDVQFWFYFAKSHRYASLMHLLNHLNTTNIVFLAFQDYTKQKLLSEKSCEPVTIPENKVGEDIIVKPKIKTLKEFMKDI